MFLKVCKISKKMKEIYCENITKIKHNKKKIEKSLNISLAFKNNQVIMQGNAINEYLVIQIIEAIDMGFSTDKALLLKDENFNFKKINLKDIVKSKDLRRVKGRLIGTHGKTKKLIQELSDCFICVHDHEVGIIGRIEDIEAAIQSIEKLIYGAKQSKVYSYLEQKRGEQKQQDFREDFGLNY
jgi:ribosomal RNA assembly protein